MKNSVSIYRLYDIANEINLSNAEKILSQSIAVSRMKLSRVSPKTIIFSDAPLSVELTPQELTICGQKLLAEVYTHIYALGIISIIIKIVLPAELIFDEAIDFSVEIGKIDEQPFLSALDTVLKTIRSSIVGEYPHSSPEDLVIFYFRKKNDWDPIPLLLAEKCPVSPETRHDTMANRFSYGEDFTILNWDTAIVYDPTGSQDIPDLLEFANAQLLKLRYYDSLFEIEIEKLYDAITQANTGAFYLKLSKYRSLRRKLFELMADITLITGKIRNSLRITEDVFYARVYTSYLRVLRVRDWEDSISSKIAVIQNSYNMLNDEAVTHRAEIMEVAIILLIALEIILSLFRH